jgi:hypothetical protein
LGRQELAQVAGRLAGRDRLGDEAVYGGEQRAPIAVEDEKLRAFSVLDHIAASFVDRVEQQLAPRPIDSGKALRFRRRWIIF